MIFFYLKSHQMDIYSYVERCPTSTLVPYAGISTRSCVHFVKILIPLFRLFSGLFVVFYRIGYGVFGGDGPPLCFRYGISLIKFPMRFHKKIACQIHKKSNRIYKCLSKCSHGHTHVRDYPPKVTV